MKNRAKTSLSLALAIVGGIAAGLRCDASEWVDNSSQTNPRPAAYTVKHIQTLLFLNRRNGGEWGMLKMDLGYPSAPGANAKRRSADKFRILRIDSIRRDTPLDVAIFFICRKI